MQYIISLFAVLFSFVTYAQNNESNTTTSIELGHILVYQSTGDWTKTSFYQDKKRGVEIINFERKAIQTDSGKTYAATQSCKVEPARATDIKNYSLSSLGFFQKKKDFKITKTFTHSDGMLQLSYAVGYWASYVDDSNVLHKVIIVHAIHPKGNGVQFFIDCPDVIFAELEEEITAQVRSLQYK